MTRPSSATTDDLWVPLANSGFDEKKHPRDKDGRFSSSREAYELSKKVYETASDGGITGDLLDGAREARDAAEKAYESEDIEGQHRTASVLHSGLSTEHFHRGAAPGMTDSDAALHSDLSELHRVAYHAHEEAAKHIFHGAVEDGKPSYQASNSLAKKTRKLLERLGDDYPNKYEALHLNLSIERNSDYDLMEATGHISISDVRDDASETLAEHYKLSDVLGKLADHARGKGDKKTHSKLLKLQDEHKEVAGLHEAQFDRILRRVKPGEVDWRPTESIPEDYYSYDHRARWVSVTSNSNPNRDDKGRFATGSTKGNSKSRTISSLKETGEVAEKHGFVKTGDYDGTALYELPDVPEGEYGQDIEVYQDGGWCHHALHPEDGEVSVIDSGNDHIQLEAHLTKLIEKGMARMVDEVPDVDWRPPEMTSEDFYTYDYRAGWTSVSNIPFDEKKHPRDKDGRFSSSREAYELSRKIYETVSDNGMTGFMLDDAKEALDYAERAYHSEDTGGKHLTALTIHTRLASEHFRKKRDAATREEQSQHHELAELHKEAKEAHTQASRDIYDGAVAESEKNYKASMELAHRDSDIVRRLPRDFPGREDALHQSGLIKGQAYSSTLVPVPWITTDEVRESVAEIIIKHHELSELFGKLADHARGKGDKETHSKLSKLQDEHKEVAALHEAQFNRILRRAKSNQVDWRPTETIPEDYYTNSASTPGWVATVTNAEGDSFFRRCDRDEEDHLEVWVPLINVTHQPTGPESSSFFRRCQRDNRGHCLPGTTGDVQPGGGASGVSDDPRKGVAPTPGHTFPATPGSRSPEKDYLHIANVTSVVTLGGGCNTSKMITLEDGSKAVFKPESGESPDVRMSIKGRYYAREGAASDIATHLGMDDLVPPTVVRKVEGSLGSVQKFIPTAQPARLVNERAKYDGERDLARAAAFDYLIGNQDRHEGNWLVNTATGSLHLIDHGLSFPDTYKDEVGGTYTKFIRTAGQRYLPIPYQVRALSSKKLEEIMRAHGLNDAEVGVARRRLADLRSSTDFNDLLINYGRKLRKVSPVTGKRPGFTVARRLKRPDQAWLENSSDSSTPPKSPSFFGRCERDNKGHCLPEGSGVSQSSVPSHPGSRSPEKDYLRVANVTAVERLDGGCNVTKIVTLQDGSEAVFKPETGEHKGQLRCIKDRYYAREAAASDIATHLGMDDMVPSTVVREVNGSTGSVQKFVPDCVSALALNETDKFDGERDLARAAAFDYLIGNQDRHQGNWLVNETTGKLHLIDHGLSFPDTYKNEVGDGSLQLTKRASELTLPIPHEFKSLSSKKLEQIMRAHGLNDAEVIVVIKRLADLKHSGNFNDLLLRYRGRVKGAQE